MSALSAVEHGDLELENGDLVKSELEQKTKSRKTKKKKKKRDKDKENLDHKENLGLANEELVDPELKKKMATEDFGLFMALDELSRETEEPPYKIVHDPHVGRYMVATRPIKEGELILCESALMTAPADVPDNPHLLACVSCMERNVRIENETQWVQCETTGLPLCHRKTCRRSSSMLGIRGVTRSFVSTLSKSSEMREAMASLLAVLNVLKLKGSKEYELLSTLMAHLKERRQSHFWTNKTQAVLDLAKRFCIEKVDVEVLEVVLGILQVNQFEVLLRSKDIDDHEHVELRALFALASIPSHHCVTNTRHTFFKRKGKLVMELMATTALAAGDEISHSYVHPLMPMLERKAFLITGKFFECTCSRCKDPTEMSTDASCIVCDCHGVCRTTNCNDMEAVWKCDKCDKEIEAQTVLTIYRDAKTLYERVGNESIEELEKLLQHPKITNLHHNHVLKVDINYHLARLHGHVAGFEPHLLTDQQLDLKVDLCQKVLKVLDKLEPGLQRRRGVMLYELHMPLVLRSQRRLQGRRLFKRDKANIKADLKLAMSSLEEGLAILGLEGSGTFEREVFDGSANALQQLRSFVATVTKTLLTVN